MDTHIVKFLRSFIHEHSYNRLLVFSLVVVLFGSISNAHAGFDGSQLNLFVPFSLIIPAAGFVTLLIALVIKNANIFCRGVAHLLSVLSVLIYLFYSGLYLREFPELQSHLTRVVFAVPLLIGVLQVRQYLQSSPQYTGFNRTALAALVVAIMLPASLATAVMLGKNFKRPSKQPNRAVTSEIKEKNTQSTVRDRRPTINLPPPPSAPVVLFPNSASVEVTINKQTVRTEHRDIDSQ